MGDPLGQIFQVANLLDATQANRLLGHAKHHAALLVLRQRGRPGIAHCLQSAGAIISHARHDDTERVAPRRFGQRTKQHVDRRLVA